MADSTILPQQLGDETIPAFARWVESAYRVIEAEDSVSELPRIAPGEPNDSTADLATTVEEIRRRLVELSELSGEPVVEAIPPEDPQRVCDISPAILNRYSVRSGHVELSGCTLEPRPFLRLTFPGSSPDRLVHIWFGDDGSRVDDQLAKRLHFDGVEPIAPRLRASDVSSIERWIAAAWRTLQVSPNEASRWNRKNLVGGTIAWCRRATGKVAIVFDDGPTAHVSFDGWAADFCSGNARPAPFRCPSTGFESYQVVALDDGTLTVPQAIARCAHSGKEVLADQLSQCELTGQHVLPDYLVRCAVTGRQVLADTAACCQWCQRCVVPGEIERHLCRDCRKRQPISRSHPLLHQIFEAHPEYRRYRSWTGWTDDSVGVFVGKHRLREIVLVAERDAADEEAVALIRWGCRWRFGGHWQMETP